MSVRERIVSDLLLLGQDGHEILSIIESQFPGVDSNSERVRLARDILSKTGIEKSQLLKLVPLLSKLVVEFSETNADVTEAELVTSAPDQPIGISAQDFQRKKKPRSKKLSPKDLQELFDIRAPTMIQRYSDDEGKPKPVIIRVNQPMRIVQPKVNRIIPSQPSKPSAWEEVVSVANTVPIDYGGFW